MKSKKLYLVPALSVAAFSPLMAQSTVDKAAANFKEGPFTDYSDQIEKAITDSADGELPEGLTTKAILDVAGLGNIKTYAQSSTAEGTEWINRFQLNNGGEHQGALKLLADTKFSDLSVANMSPEGTDFAVQFAVNLKSAESSILSFMKTGAKEEEITKFQASMGEQAPMLGVTNSELLQKLDLRVNLAIDLDPNEKLPTPIGEFDKPNLVIRFDGIHWIWDKVGAALVGQSGLPFEKSEAEGITTFSLPAEFSAQSMGYSPVIRVDAAKDQVWISSTPEFLGKCTSGENTLASSQAYKDTMAGLPESGQVMTYMSKDFAVFLKDTLSNLKEQGMFESNDATSKAQIDTAIEQLGKVNKGAAQVISLNESGVFIAERGVQNIDQKMADFHKMMKQIKEAKKEAAPAPAEAEGSIQ